MIVSLGLLSGEVVVAEDGLDAVPDFLGDQRFVDAVVGRSAEGDLSLVVRVRQHPVDARQGGSFGGPLGCGEGGEAAVDQFLAQGDGGVVAGGVGLEGPLDQWCTLGIEFDGAHLPPQLIADAHVEVADGCLAAGAAGDRLLGHALGHLVGQVAGVELRDGGHDPVEQHPRGRLVDVLSGGDEPDPGFLQSEVDGHVVGAVAGEPVNLVDDAVGDVVLLDVLDHLHQFGPVGLACGLPGVDEFLHDDRSQFAGLAQVRLALCGDREALVPSAAFGLFLGGHPEVGHRERGGLTGALMSRRW
ncbi:MAG: hypothetical protein QM713_17500 [Arachnia sp.]